MNDNAITYIKTLIDTINMAVTMENYIMVKNTAYELFRFTKEQTVNEGQINKP